MAEIYPVENEPNIKQLAVEIERLKEREKLIINALKDLKNESEQQKKQNNIIMSNLSNILEILEDNGSPNSNAVEPVIKENNEFEKKDRTYWEYIKEKFMDSAVVTLYIGNGLVVDDIDEVVNALVLVNSLIVTIPFGVMADLNSDYWQAFDEAYKSCKKEIIKQPKYEYFISICCSLIYPALCCIAVTVLYYLFRPRRDAEFGTWWCKSAGRHIFIILLAGTISSCFGVFFLTSFLLQYVARDFNELCTDSTAADSVRISYVLVCTILLYVLFRVF